MSSRPDCRRFVCDRCRRARYICSNCDRGHRYCGEACSRSARARSVRRAGRRYQQTRRGRLAHARSQDRYRHRKQDRSNRKVTHHGCPPEQAFATVHGCLSNDPNAPISTVAPPPTQILAASATLSTLIRCFRCHQWCTPLVRHDFLRVRRRHRRQGASGHDLARAKSTDPPSS